MSGSKRMRWIVAGAMMASILVFAATALGSAAGQAGRSLVVIKQHGSGQMSADHTLKGHFTMLVDGVIQDSGTTVITPNLGNPTKVDGQQQNPVVGYDNLKTKKGSLTLVFHGVSIPIANINPAKDFLEIEYGTWKVQSSTGDYAGWKGSGRWADHVEPDGEDNMEWDGYITH